MTREPIEVTRLDRIYCLKASSDYHSEVCEECKFYPNCDHMTQDDMTELTIKDLEALEQEPSVSENPNNCDLISREAVEEIINDIRSCISVEGYWAILERLKKLPSVKPQELKWIPVSEKLPEEETAVLISCEDLYLHRLNPCIGWRNGQYWNTFTANGCKQILYPTAWMPLPKPYELPESEG